jgi:hypothetical protein
MKYVACLFLSEQLMPVVEVDPLPDIKRVSDYHAVTPLPPVSINSVYYPQSVGNLLTSIRQQHT